MRPDALLFCPEYEREPVAEALGAAIATGGCFELESDFVSAKGSLRRVRCIGEVENVGGMPVAVIGVMQDITERHGMETELLRLARTDHLTGPGNRAEFDRVLDARLDVAASTGDELAMLLIDLDVKGGRDDLLRCVDAALYAAKRTTKGTVSSTRMNDGLPLNASSLPSSEGAELGTRHVDVGEVDEQIVRPAGRQLLGRLHLAPTGMVSSVVPDCPLKWRPWHSLVNDRFWENLHTASTSWMDRQRTNRCLGSAVSFA